MLTYDELYDVVLEAIPPSAYKFSNEYSRQAFVEKLYEALKLAEERKESHQC